MTLQRNLPDPCIRGQLASGFSSLPAGPFYSHAGDREAWAAEAERLHRIGDRKGRKHALERVRAATMAMLADEVRQ